MESLERRRKYRYAKDATSGNQILVKQYDFLCYLKTKVKKQFDAQGISIPFPQRDVHVYEHKE